MANQPATKPRLLRRFFQFRLLTLLILMVLVGFASMRIASLLDNRPFDWLPYSKSSFERYIEEKKTVLIFFTAEWDMTSVVTEVAVFEDEQVRRLVRSRNVIAMKADISKRNAETAEIFKSIAENETSTVAIYSARSANEPVVLRGLISVNELCETLENATH